MADSSVFQIDPDSLSVAGETPPPGAGSTSKLDAALAELDRQLVPASMEPPVVGPQADNQLVQVRLGIAASLHAALRFRYAATAAHALRVALSCSGWALRSNVDPHLRDAIEVAALLHDVGVIGVPDEILLKPGPLDADEITVFEQSRRMTAEILRNACAEPEIMDIVENIGAWYDGTRGGYRLVGDEIPLGARMIAIAEAFDSMITDQVFRRAISHERALRELFACAGSQFDPALVEQFVTLCTGDLPQLRKDAARHWLQALDPETANAFWEMSASAVPELRGERASPFEVRLLENMHDAVVFVDKALRIVQWNHGAERLTGIAASSILQRPWSPSLLNLQNEKGNWVTEEDCPVANVVHSGVQSLRRLTISGRGGRPVAVDSHAMPVVADDGTSLGVVLLLHDASSESSLEERCQNLHERATKDPLTEVANRAEFDRVHEMFVNTHREQRVPCALAICDLDHFKLVNDTYGHQAGDEVIKCLAALLRNSCRPGDLVARYGGEEFVLLCADCDNATAFRRADQIRKKLGETAQPHLEGRKVTVSFGVTEIQPGDTPETMLRRADRALLTAKEKGRNRVVQLGVGSDERRGRWGLMSWWRKEESPAPPLVVEQTLVTPVPIAVAIEKLRGFVADHRAKILRIEGNQVQLQIDDHRAAQSRRAADRPIAFRMNLQFEEERIERQQPRWAGTGSVVSRTRIQVTVSPHKNRDRRRGDVGDLARELMVSFRAYLMASEEEPQPAREGVLRRASRILTPWLLKR